jgi:hypothetical protein
MTRISKSAALALFALGAAIGAPGARAADPKPLDRDVVEKEIVRLAARLRKAITDRDVPGVMTLVGPRGIPCIDDVIARKRIEHDLRDRTSRLHALLFDGESLRSRHADAGVTESWREMFLAHPDTDVLVTFQLSPGQDPWSWPCAEFIATDEGPPRVVCFARQSGRWSIIDSLYECG